MEEITRRLHRYFERQAGWLEEGIAALDAFDCHAADAGADDFAQQQERRARELEHFEREARGLLREWQAAQGVTDAERAEVRALAERTRNLAERLRARCEEAGQTASEACREQEAQLGELRRAHGVHAKFHPDSGARDSGRIDRRA
jgi:hypothetical protein